MWYRTQTVMQWLMNAFTTNNEKHFMTLPKGLRAALKGPSTLPWLSSFASRCAPCKAEAPSAVAHSRKLFIELFRIDDDVTEHAAVMELHVRAFSSDGRTKVAPRFPCHP